MKRYSILTIALFLFILFTQTVFAATREWKLDNNHTNFYFRVAHIFSKIGGQFNEFSGEIKFDPENLAESRFFFEIQTDSVDTNISKRDKHLQSADFFDSQKYPLMTFESKKITKTGDNVYQIDGIFTVKGEPYSLTLPLAFAGIKDHPAMQGKEVIGFNGGLNIDRLAYKVGTGKFYDMGIVGKDVEIFVSIEALSDM